MDITFCFHAFLLEKERTRVTIKLPTPVFQCSSKEVLSSFWNIFLLSCVLNLAYSFELSHWREQSLKKWPVTCGCTDSFWPLQNTLRPWLSPVALPDNQHQHSNISEAQIFGPAELLYNGLKTVVKWIFGRYSLRGLFGHQIQQVHEQLLLGFPTARSSTHQAPLHPGAVGLHTGKTMGIWPVKASLKFMTPQLLYFPSFLVILSSQRPQRGFAGPILSWSLWCIFASELGGNNSSRSVRKLGKLPSAQQLPQNSAF